jgi:hypothetical protein
VLQGLFDRIELAAFNFDLLKPLLYKIAQIVVMVLMNRVYGGSRHILPNPLLTRLARSLSFKIKILQ